ncbi:MAG: hypothetical protein KAT39_02085, partial [Alphaproteobacteria bacterium]|nr:hypothetical protein [Alphaproteobacteria bacterium]
PMRVHRAAGRACPAGRKAPSYGLLSTSLGISLIFLEIEAAKAEIYRRCAKMPHRQPMGSYP